MRLHTFTILVTLFTTAPLRAEEPFKLQPDSIKHSGAICAIAFSPDGKLLAVGGEGKPDDSKQADTPGTELVIWDVKLRQKVSALEGHTRPVNAVAFSPDGKTLASASADKTVRLWDVGTGKELAVLRDAPIGARKVAFSPDDKTLAAVTASSTDPDWAWNWKVPNHVLLWDVATRKVRVNVEAKPNTFWSLAYSPDGKELAVGCGKYDEKKEEWNNGEVRLLNPETGKLLKTLEIPQSRVIAVAFSPDGKFLATGSDSVSADDRQPKVNREVWGEGDGVVKLWDLNTAKVRVETKVALTRVDSLAFSADGNTLAYSTGSIYRQVTRGFMLSLSIYGEVVLLDGRTLKKLATLPRHDGRNVEALSFSPTGRVLATGDESTLKLWEIAERR